MGMPVIVDVHDAGVAEDAVDEVFRWLRWVDDTFSTYKTDSQISRLNRGELLPGDADKSGDVHPVVWRVLRRCEEFRERTEGYFDICAPYGPGGRGPEPGRGAPGSVEPSGYVKGWAVAEAARMLERAGAANYCVNAGGDIQLSGHADGDERWRIGIQHPRDPYAVALTLGLSEGAIATSGAYVRGHHIADPHTGACPEGLLSVTSTGPDLATADVYATAAFAMGFERAAGWCAGLADEGYEAVLISADDVLLSTPGIDGLRA